VTRFTTSLASIDAALRAILRNLLAAIVDSLN
jgi:hypothetical protein